MTFGSCERLVKGLKIEVQPAKMVVVEAENVTVLLKLLGELSFYCFSSLFS